MQRKLQGPDSVESDWRVILKEMAARKGLTQTELARALLTSQATISKILAGKSVPRPGLRKRIVILAATDTFSDEWLARVGTAARQYPEFFEIVNAALRLMNANE
jgi:transcriptional regulator with XRE-family HTH domain